MLSPGQGLSPQSYKDLLGLKAQRDMLEEDYFYPSDLQDNRIEAKTIVLPDHGVCQ